MYIILEGIVGFAKKKKFKLEDENSTMYLTKNTKWNQFGSIKNYLSSGQIFGETALVNRERVNIFSYNYQPRDATAIAITDISLVVISELILEDIKNSIKNDNQKEFMALMFPKPPIDKVKIIFDYIK